MLEQEALTHFMHTCYKHYRTTGKWDDSACYISKDTKYAADDDGRRNLQGGEQQNNEGGNNGNYKSRCAKMDCHLENTHFSVLGEFSFCVDVMDLLLALCYCLIIRCISLNFIPTKSLYCTKIKRRILQTPLPRRLDGTTFQTRRYVRLDRRRIRFHERRSQGLAQRLYRDGSGKRR